MLKKLIISISIVATATPGWFSWPKGNQAAMEFGHADGLVSNIALDSRDLEEMGLSAEDVRKDPSCLDWFKKEAKAQTELEKKYAEVRCSSMKKAAMLAAGTCAIAVSSGFAEDPATKTIAAVGVSGLSTLFGQEARFLLEDIKDKRAKYGLLVAASLGSVLADTKTLIGPSGNPIPLGLSALVVGALTRTGKRDSNKGVKDIEKLTRKEKKDAKKALAKAAKKQASKFII